ncbi:MAG: hypothetical protein NC930_04220 [Candidatus Omnitrophica bacterium]|nr:hypothetical protein [Candidatus Omnitrophota bacterium]
MMRRWIFTILILGVVATVVAVVFFGMRVHPEAIPAYFESQKPTTIVELKLKNGNQIVAPLIEETPSGLRVTIDDFETSFTREEIDSVRTLTAEDLSSETYQGMGSWTPKKDPILTFEGKDRIINLAQIQKDQKKTNDLYFRIGKQREKDKQTEKILDQYAQHDARIAQQLARQRQQNR